jgi:indole-3-glycerol phosphate synthase
MSASVLDAIVASSRRSAIERSRQVTLTAVERIAAARAPRPGAFREALARPGIRVIAECKRRSPSRGILRRDYVPQDIAAGYARAGAAAISILTESAFFDGDLDHLRAVRKAVPDVPVLRKDFIVTRYQVAEARAAGADAVLLIVAVLDDRALASLMADAAAFGLDALVETHDATEVQRALDAGATIVGVNSRNLRTLEMDPGLFERVAGRFPSSVVAVAESGISSAGDVLRLTTLGYRAFLIGERFMTSPDPGGALAEFLTTPGIDSRYPFPESSAT